MLKTGNQLRAARSLIRITQAKLAKLAGVNTSTISAMEKQGAGLLKSGLDTVDAIEKALDAAGVEMLDGGCQLKR